MSNFDTARKRLSEAVSEGFRQPGTWRVCPNETCSAPAVAPPASMRLHVATVRGQAYAELPLCCGTCDNSLYPVEVWPDGQIEDGEER